MSQQTAAGWSSQRKKITLGGILGAAASLATIATFLTTHTPSPPNPTPPAVSPFPTHPAADSATPAPATTAGSAYPASAQSQIVSECEASQGAPASYCQCNVTWLQANVPYSMFRQAPATFEQEADGSASC
jgi:hypothetical protein